MKSTRKEYLIIGEVKKIVFDDEEAAYWGDRDCWTMHDIREKFEAYFACLKADAKRDGYRVCKSEEWVRFVDKAREDGKL